MFSALQISYLKINPYLANGFILPMKPKIFWYFQGVANVNIGQIWVKNLK